MSECYGARALSSNPIKLDMLLRIVMVSQFDCVLMLVVAKTSVDYLEIKVSSIKAIEHASSVA
jgi:hypothetical protein